MNALTRRNLFLGSVAVLPAMLVSCTGPNIDVIATVAKFVQVVQQRVVDTIKKVCSTATAFVPTVDTILAIAAQILKTTSIVTGNLGDAVAQIQAIVDTIVTAGCPTPAPAPAPGATFNGVPIHFY